MADLTPKTIGELPSAGTHNGAELLVISQSGDSKKTTIADLVYPVGSIYMSVNSTSPATLFGGTWTQIQDTFLLAAGSTYAAGATGGEATHTLTENEMPSHRHGAVFNVVGTGDFFVVQGASRAGGTSPYAYSGYTGGGAAHNNMPPYLAVYVWRRTA